MSRLRAATSQLAMTAAVFREVLGDGSMRRVILASVGFSIGEQPSRSRSPSLPARS